MYLFTTNVFRQWYNNVQCVTLSADKILSVIDLKNGIICPLSLWLSKGATLLCATFSNPLLITFVGDEFLFVRICMQNLSLDVHTSPTMPLFYRSKLINNYHKYTLNI